MSKVTLGNESLVGSLTPSNKKSYKVTNRIQEGKKPLYAVVFNFLDSRFFSVFVTAGGNKVKSLLLLLFWVWVCLGFGWRLIFALLKSSLFWSDFGGLSFLFWDVVVDSLVWKIKIETLLDGFLLYR